MGVRHSGTLRVEDIAESSVTTITLDANAVAILDVLTGIRRELQVANRHLSLMTDTVIQKADIDG